MSCSYTGNPHAGIRLRLPRRRWWRFWQRRAVICDNISVGRVQGSIFFDVTDGPIKIEGNISG